MKCFLNLSFCFESVDVFVAIVAVVEVLEVVVVAGGSGRRVGGGAIDQRRLLSVQRLISTAAAATAGVVEFKSLINQYHYALSNKVDFTSSVLTDSSIRIAIFLHPPHQCE